MCQIPIAWHVSQIRHVAALKHNIQNKEEILADYYNFSHLINRNLCYQYFVQELLSFRIEFRQLETSILWPINSVQMRHIEQIIFPSLSQHLQKPEATTLIPALRTGVYSGIAEKDAFKRNTLLC